MEEDSLKDKDGVSESGESSGARKRRDRTTTENGEGTNERRVDFSRQVYNSRRVREREREREREIERCRWNECLLSSLLRRLLRNEATAAAAAPALIGMD